MSTELDHAHEELRRAVYHHDHAFDSIERAFWAEQINQAAYNVNLEIHKEFPERHNHPGPYRPYRISDD